MNKFLLTVSLIFVTALPSFAMKVIDTYKWGTHEKVEVKKVFDALTVRIDFNRMRAPVYVSNLDCHEYSKTYTLNSSKGATYVLPARLAERVSTKASDYVQSIFEKYPNDIYFAANGYGLYANLVGEFFIGDVSLSEHLIEKGYCTRVENKPDDNDKKYPKQLIQ